MPFYSPLIDNNIITQLFFSAGLIGNCEKKKGLLGLECYSKFKSIIF